MIEWLYSGQVKLTIPQCDDAMLLAKQCKLEQLKDEIQHAVTKANSFGKSYSFNLIIESSSPILFLHWNKFIDSENPFNF